MVEWAPGSAVALEPASEASLHRELVRRNQSRQDSHSLSPSPVCRHRPRLLLRIRRISRE